MELRDLGKGKIYFEDASALAMGVFRDKFSLD